METTEKKDLLDSTLENIEKISSSLDKNIFIANARKSFSEKISEYELADDEKAKLIAQYEANVSIGIVGEIIKLAKETPLDEAQLKNLNADISIKNEQEKIAKEQVCSEKAKTKLILEQILTEKYRHNDIRTSISAKLASLEVTKQQALFEESRRYIALQSNNQNTFMKKADYWNAFLDAMSKDDKVVIKESQLESVKSAIEAIPTDKIEYRTEVDIPKSSVKDDEISAVVLECDKAGNEDV
ncbi:hypothetical protein ACNSOO_04705 [Aliarcobacter lanthieri]|uniref:hypothetical protein n=1 Tax=Aliarcobacter lanthieri TaxID=1355374 RepID=UPI003AABF150